MVSFTTAMSLWMWSQSYALCVQCFLFLVLKCPHVAKIGTVCKAQCSPSDSRTFIMQPDAERHITKLLIVCEHTHYFKKNSLYLDTHTHTHCWHLTVSWMSASFSKKLVNIPRNRSCLNCHRLPLQHPYCTCVCLGVCVHACFNSLLSIVPARWDQFYIERSIISSYQSFRQFNRISGSFIYKSKCSSSILNQSVLHPYWSHSINRTPHRMMPMLRRDRVIDFSQVIPDLLLTFQSARWFGFKLAIKREKCIFLAFALLAGIYFLWTNLLTCKCQTESLHGNCCGATIWCLMPLKCIQWGAYCTSPFLKNVLIQFLWGYFHKLSSFLV